MTTPSPQDQELYKALEWKIENEDWPNKQVGNKIRDLALWFEVHKYFTAPQRAFVEDLIKKGSRTI